MKRTKLFSRVGFLALSLALLLVLSGCAPGITDDVDVEDLDIVETAEGAEIFDTLLAAAAEAGLVDTLKSEGPFTVFAPTDDAFVDLLDGLEITAGDLLEDERLVNILKYHVLAGKVMAGDLSDGDTPETLLIPQILMIGVADEKVTVNDIEVTTPDIEASNGVIHVIDGVLFPPDIVETAEGAEIFDTLLAAAAKAGLVDALKSDDLLTVFAPTDDAFVDLLDDLEITADDLLASDELEDILLYHVVSGQVMSADLSDGQEVETLLDEKITITINDGVFVNDAEVSIADIETLNGVIHVIDAVLWPPDL